MSNTTSNGSGCGLPPFVFGCVASADEDLWYRNCRRLRLLLRIPILLYALASTYLSVLLIYAAATDKPKRKPGKAAILLKRSRMITTFVVTIVMIYSTFSMLIQEQPSVNCNWFGKMENALFWISYSAVYLTIWVRQRALFSQPNFKHLVSPITSFLSYSTIVLVVALPVTNIGLFSGKVSFCYDAILRVCAIRGYDELLFASEIVVPVILPSFMVTLFAWPLVLHHKRTAGSARGQKSVMTVVRRVLILTIICLLTDITTVVCNGYLPIIVSFVARQTSVFANLVCMFLSFADWKAVLFPKNSEPKDEPQKTAVTGMGGKSIDMLNANISTI